MYMKIEDWWFSIPKIINNVLQLLELFENVIGVWLFWTRVSNARLPAKLTVDQIITLLS